jgi:hypothetical protein
MTSQALYRLHPVSSRRFEESSSIIVVAACCDTRSSCANFDQPIEQRSRGAIGEARGLLGSRERHALVGER